MKKVIRVLFLTMLLGISCVNMVFAAVDETEQTDATHEFTIIPGTQAWNDMTLEQRVESCKVSGEEMEKMTTSALISTILEYPYVINIFAYDSAELGIASLKDTFLGIEILMKRDDALDELNMYLSKIENDESGSCVDELILKTLINYMDCSDSAVMENNNLMRASSATVYTPNGTAVKASYDRTWWDALCTEAYAVELSNEYLNVYPTAQIVRTPTPKYNCHSYAWYSTSAGNLYWINDPTAYISDGSYRASYAKKNNKITYTDNSTGEIKHSGIVNSTENGTYVFSKWGNLALFYHKDYDCPYAGEGITIQFWSRE